MRALALLELLVLGACAALLRVPPAARKRGKGEDLKVLKDKYGNVRSKLPREVPAGDKEGEKGEEKSLVASVVAAAAEGPAREGMTAEEVHIYGSLL